MPSSRTCRFFVPVASFVAEQFLADVTLCDNSTRVGGYGMKKVRPFQMHEEACEHLISGIAEPNRLRCLEEQFAEASRTPASDSTALVVSLPVRSGGNNTDSLDTLGILSLLAFGPGNTQPPLLHPLQFALGDTNQQRFHSQDDNGISADVLRAKVSVAAPYAHQHGGEIALLVCC